MAIFTVIDAATVSPDGDTTPINGIPNFHTKTFGKFTAKFPYIAAGKALTSIHKHLVKYSSWFPTYNGQNPPQFIIVMKNIETGKKYAYLGNRIQAEQRVVLGEYGRHRVYQWNSKIQPISLNSVGWD
jgi:hypothetical protein